MGLVDPGDNFFSEVSIFKTVHFEIEKFSDYKNSGTSK